MTAAGRALAEVWEKHRVWSAVAEASQRRIVVRRRLNLVLLTVGALMGAVAAVGGWPSWLTSTAAGIAAVVLGAAGLLQARFLNPGEIGRWSGARAASEALKAEVFRHLAGVAPYAGPDRDERLRERADEVRAVTSGLQVDFQLAVGDGKQPPAVCDLSTYVEKRARHQAGWHRGRVGKHQRLANRLRAAELGATGVGMVLAALAAAVRIDLAVWVGAASTVAAVFAAHLTATRHDRIAATYAATAGQLDDLVARLPEEPDGATAARFVDAVERVLVAQNEGWVGLLRQG